MNGREFFAWFLSIDARLEARGFPPLSRFWRRALEKFYRSGRKRFVLRVGRRGGKSLTMAKIAVAVALAEGLWTVPRGDVAVIPFVSVDRGEAASRLRTVASMLDALGVSYDRRAEEIELKDRPVIFRVLTASLRGVVGATCVAVFCDEVAKWRDADTGANPAKEILASLVPTTATIPSARIFISSSPWSTTDFHAELFDVGDCDHQLVAHAASWEANPTLSESKTHALEPDPRVWLREYGAEPSDSISSVCTAQEYDACAPRGVTVRHPTPEGFYATTVDASILKHDAFVVGSWHKEMRQRPDGLVEVLVLDKITALSPSFLRPVGIEDGVEAIAAHVRAYPGPVYGDQYYAETIRAALAARAIRFAELPSTSASITARIAALQVRFASGSLDLVDDERLRKEVLQAQLVLHPGNRMTLRAPDKRGCHDDHVSVVLLACDREVSGRLPLSSGDVVTVRDPIRWEPERHRVSGGGTRYFTRSTHGALVPCEPPYGSISYRRWAEEMRAKGALTPSLERWRREQGVDDVDRRPRLNVPIK